MILPLTPGQLEASRLLSTALPGVRVVLVGAAALRCQIPLRLKTEDIDFVVAASLEATTHLENAPGWRRHPKRAHEWTAPNGVQVDLVPASADALVHGEVVWPDGGRMNLCGIRLVFDHARAVDLGDDAELRIAHVSVIALLKMVAYLDRNADTEKDLVHLVDIFDGYPDDNDDRLYTQEQAADGLRPEEARVQVLARELAPMLDRRERDCCRAFVRRMREPTHMARMLRRMPQPADDREMLHLRRLEILETELAL